MSTTILVIGLMVFFAHFLSLQFRRTNIPDVLVLMLVGIVIGPVLGIVTSQDFGKIGSLIATIALVVILFESGTTLNLNVLHKSLRTTGVLSITCFVMTALIVTLIGLFVLNLTMLPAILLGATLGGTSSAVVIPMVNALRLTLTRFIFRDPGYSLRDAAITSTMAPKGLAAAVLVSITVTALLVMAYPLPAMQRIYGRTLGKQAMTDKF